MFYKLFIFSTAILLGAASPAQLIKYTSNGKLSSTGGDEPGIVLKSTPKGVAWIAPEKPLTGDFKIEVKVSAIEAYRGGYQFRLVTPAAIKAKAIGKKYVGMNIAHIYFSANKNKPSKIRVCYKDAKGKLYTFDWNRKWVAKWRPTAFSWSNDKTYILSAIRKDSKITFSITTLDKTLFITAPIDASTIEGGTGPCSFMLGDAMTPYSGGRMTVNSVVINGKKSDLKKLCEGLSVEKKMACGLPYDGVFKFGKNKGYLQLPQNYDPSKKYPFILCFHGRGGSAISNNFTSSDFMGFKKLCSEKGFIIAVPGYGSDCWLNESGEKITLEMIDFLEKKLSINPKQFYVMGCSMGGASALVFTIRHPEKVTAVCDIFGITDYVKFYNKGFYNKSIKAAYGGTPSEKPKYYAERSAINYIDVLKKKPLLVIHGTRDFCVPKWNSDELVAKLKAENANVEYIVVPGMNHNNAIIKGLENKIIDFFEKYR
jgi:hypothetical protein